MDKTFSIKTLGCKLNQYESGIIAGRFLANGWNAVPFGRGKADVVIINTCTVTDRSDKKCRNYIRQGARFSKKGGVYVTGCMVDADAEAAGKMPGVLAVFRNSEKERMLNLIEVMETAAANDTEYHGGCSAEYGGPAIESTISPRLMRTRGFIKIQDGCDGACSYCIIPSVRGLPSSREYDDIIRHAEKLVNDGCPEIILTGITIGGYKNGGADLAGVIRGILDIPGRFRVRISSIEPNHITNDLIFLLGHDKVCPHLHIPLQSGSDKILSAMKRRYTSGEYLWQIDKIKTAHPDIAIGTDIIIGFPGEDENDFAESLAIVEKAKLSYVHQFTFSARSGTDASGMKRNCTGRALNERSAVMKELSVRVGLEYRRGFIGSVLPSVIEKNKNTAEYSGLSGNYIRIILDESPLNSEKAGTIAGVRLLEAEPGRIRGEIIAR